MQDLTPQTVFKELYRCLTLSNGENYGGLRCMVFHSAGLKKLGRVPFAHWKGLCAEGIFLHSFDTVRKEKSGQGVM